MMMLNTPAPALPIGSILAYAGLLADIPTGWAICDGTNGTPDLTDSFVMGGSHAQIGQTGGNNTVTPSGSVSVNNHTLSASQMPSHDHTLYADRNDNPGYHARGTRFGHVGDGYAAVRNVGTSWIGHTGSSGAHNHGASLSLNSQDNKPKYYKSAYIMRVA